MPGEGTYNNTIGYNKKKFYIESNIPRFTTSNNGKPGIGDYNKMMLKFKKKEKNRNIIL